MSREEAGKEGPMLPRRRRRDDACAAAAQGGGERRRRIYRHADNELYLVLLDLSMDRGKCVSCKVNKHA